ncbi:carbohydrate porin [Cerasicoccus arenae]|uniref:Porin B n=1 Tax=Cerasicoccus arenae TaxID=424488 RepID=A0A8J3DEQ2_9BACT|nr:carbohydrate porin [Cerasicoccus arenae]MBK1858459.1 carbohydrate porin [Cerasicoccus arenae]GHC10522.1 porin B [Cerasicoccus arenae]
MRRNIEVTRYPKITMRFAIPLILATSALAAPPSSPDDDLLSLANEEYLLDANGWRGHFAEETGITFIANYAVDVLGNPVGGLNNKLRYSTLGLFGANVQLGTLTNEDWLAAWSFQATGYNAEGKNLANDIGNAIQPSTLFSGVVPVGLSEVYLSGQWDNVLARLGRITPEDYFAASPLWDYFVSLAYNDNPWNLNTNNPNFSGSPSTLWMAGADWQIDSEWKISIAAANTSRPDLTAPSKRGVDFHFDPLDGTMFLAEICYHWRVDFGQPQALSGSAQVGGYHDTAQFTRITKPPAGVSPTKPGLSAAWVILEQQLIAGESVDDIGLTTWLLASWGGPKSIANSPWFFSTGFVYEGLLPSRPDDALAFGYSINWFNNQLTGQNHETDIELTYLIQLTPWLSIQPDLQVILDPNGMNSINDALVLGFQCAVDF